MDGEIIRMYHPLYTTNPLGNPKVAERICVRLIGLEPTRLATPDPKSGAYTNFATGAFQLQKYIMCHDFQRKGRTFFVQWWRICIFVIQTLCRYELCPVVSLR